MACDRQFECPEVLNNHTYCRPSSCSSNGQNYPKTLFAVKVLGCRDGSTTTCEQSAGCCY